MAETENNQWAKGASRAKYTVRHYGRNYSVITEQSECGRLRFYATIESLYRANRFTETVRKQNGNFSMTPTVAVLTTISQRTKLRVVKETERRSMTVTNVELVKLTTILTDP